MAPLHLKAVGQAHFGVVMFLRKSLNERTGAAVLC